ncbi:MAG TPA: amidohydrolase family protein, partial [Acidimicrobiales bacterium]|nr:amidohydrolase family protein [Acidimicrobiales bacterium]
LRLQRERGGEVYLQISCLPGVMQIVLTDPFPFGRVAAFAEIFALPREERATLYRDQAWRERAKEGIEKERDVWLPRWERMRVEETVVHADLQNGPAIGTLAREREVDPFDLLCDLALADDLQTRFRIVLANDDEEELFGLLSEEGTIIGLSDAGAHASQLCDAGYSSHLLGYWVREKGALTLEHAVHRLTDEPARAFGIAGRGRIAAGFAADLVAFDPDTVGVAGRERVHDLPTGADRIVAYSSGIDSVWVNGTAIRRAGADLDGARPGHVLRA